MADFLNEQEQVDVIKNWWKKNGKSTIAAIVVAILMVVGWQYWHARKAKITNAASVSYQVLLNADKAGRVDDATAQANLIIKSYPSTPYAMLSELMLAKYDVDQNHISSAIKTLQSAKSDAGSAVLPLIDLRLARLYVANHQDAKALSLIQSVPKGYEWGYYMLKAQIQVAKGQIKAAHATYDKAAQYVLDNKAALALTQMQMNDLQVS